MPRTVTYHLRANQLVTLAGAAQAQIVRSGRITGVQLNASGTGGAGSGFAAISADLNNPSQAFGDTNNPPRESFLAGILWAVPNAGTGQLTGPYIPLSVPVTSGDIVSLGQVISGTAPAAFRAGADIYVMENGG